MIALILAGLIVLKLAVQFWLDWLNRRHVLTHGDALPAAFNENRADANVCPAEQVLGLYAAFFNIAAKSASGVLMGMRLNFSTSTNCSFPTMVWRYLILFSSEMSRMILLRSCFMASGT